MRNFSTALITGIVLIGALIELAACERREDAPSKSSLVTGDVQVAVPASPPESQNSFAEAPPTVEGLYIVKILCPGEGGCTSTRWRATAAIDVHERIDTTSAVIATIPKDAWVDALEGQVRLVPQRGVVQRTTQGLAAGDVVYLLESQGEGFFSLWRRGEELTWMPPASAEEKSAIQWDESAADGPTLGWWVHVKLENGKDGWVREPRNFACMGGLAGDEGC